MRGLTIRVLNKFIHLLTITDKSNQKNNITQTPEYIQAKRVEQWFKDEGDKTHRLNYDLNSDSIVFDLGGYEGQWASDIYAKYNCSIMIFEPYIPYAQNIEKRFERNNKIKVYRYGLGAKTEKVGFSMLDNASSIFAKGPKEETIDIVSVLNFLEENDFKSVDLVKINIEGGEYDLLESLIDNDKIKIFKNIQVQFHDFIIDNAQVRMESIQKKLSRTHQLTYEYNFVWENWKLKD